MTLALVMDYLPFPGETQFIGAAHSRRSSSSTTGERSLSLRANYGQWFPNLLSQSQFNRRLRKLGQMLETLRRKWVRQLGGENATSFVIDTKPIPVMGYRRSKRSSDFQGSADADAMRPSRLAAFCANALRYCAARKMKYFGYKLVLLSTLKGLPIAYELVSANTDERKSVEGILETVRNGDIYADKGFIGQDWQQQIASSTGNRIWTIHRQNQHHQNSSNLRRLISRVRQRIEGVFHEIQNTGRNPERLLNKTVRGLATHMTAKIASHTLRLLLRDCAPRTAKQSLCNRCSDFRVCYSFLKSNSH